MVGRPVHTILLPEFQENQEGVLHFHYLLSVGGGVLRAGRSFEEHHAQLVASLRSFEPGTNAGFVREFIRPHGLDRAATPLFCDAVEALLRMPAPAPERTPVRFLLLRSVMFPVFHALRRIYGSEIFRDDWSRKERAHQARREARVEARAERQRATEARRRGRDERRVETLAAREAMAREAETARVREEETKVQRKLAREREKAAHARRRARAAMRGRLKQTASRWLSRWRPGRQTP